MKIEEFSTSVATYGRGLDVANLLPKELAHPCTKEFLKIHGNLQKSIINDDSKIYIYIVELDGIGSGTKVYSC